MNGIVNADLELTLDLFLKGPGGDAHITAIIDTGYNGSLSLPFRVIDALDLPRLTMRSVTLSDGSRRMSPVYEIEVDWDGQFKSVEVLCMAGDAIIGTALLKGFRLEADFVAGGLVGISHA